MPTIASMNGTMLDLRDGLRRAKGHWPRIASDTGIDYFTIARIARGETPNPRIDTVEKIHGWLGNNAGLLAPEAAA